MLRRHHFQICLGKRAKGVEPRGDDISLALPRFGNGNKVERMSDIGEDAYGPLEVDSLALSCLYRTLRFNALDAARTVAVAHHHPSVQIAAPPS